jgi:hypothetical protein
MRIILYILIAFIFCAQALAAGRIALLDNSGTRHTLRTIDINNFEYTQAGAIEKAFGGPKADFLSAPSSFFVSVKSHDGRRVIVQMSRPAIEYRGRLYLPLRSFISAYSVAAGVEIEMRKKMIKIIDSHELTSEQVESEESVPHDTRITTKMSPPKKAAPGRTLKQMKDDHFRRAFLRTARYLNKTITAMEPEKKYKKDIDPAVTSKTGTIAEDEQIPANMYVIPKKLIRRELESFDSD